MDMAHQRNPKPESMRSVHRAATALVELVTEPTQYVVTTAAYFCLLCPVKPTLPTGPAHAAALY